jgi:hypothetical protein
VGDPPGGGGHEQGGHSRVATTARVIRTQYVHAGHTSDHAGSAGAAARSGSDSSWIQSGAVWLPLARFGQVCRTVVGGAISGLGDHPHLLVRSPKR